MEDDSSAKRRQLSKIFKENFQSSTVQQHHRVHVNQLNKKLNQWKLETNEKIEQIVKEKSEEIDQFYDQYSQEMNEKYTNINRQIENENSLVDINDQIENFNTYCQSNTIENCIRLNTTPISKDQLAENIELEYNLYIDPPTRRRIQPLESPIKERSIERLESTVKERIIEPLKSVKKERTDSIHSIHTSSIGSPIPVPVDRRSIQEPSKYEPALKPESNISREEPFTSLYETTTRTAIDNLRKSPTRLYIGKNTVLTPVLVGKDREVYNETEKITEYSIDSIPLPQDKQEQSSDINSDNEMTLVFAYKVLIQAENDYQQSSISSASDREEEEDDDDDDNDEHPTNINIKFNLKKFDQINYTTLMFRKCETEYNCISSSTKRNELILYNSKLNVLIMLQYHNYQQCRQRFYLPWPKTLSPNISDITYCQNNDHFLISTWDSSHIYLFNRDLLSVSDLGKLSNDLPLRRIHCYQQTIYCIISNNYLLEYQIDEQYSRLTAIKKIKLFNPIDHLQEIVYYLLDITCDENYLIIIYSNQHDEIHLQSIIRQTKQFHQDILLDIRQPINQIYLRIESTYSKGNFLYLNGSEQHLKAIDLVNYNKGKITSTIRRHTKPTNICFLQDKRLVILYEHPYFLSVHDLSNRQEVN